jgi:hypothetical protein
MGHPTSVARDKNHNEFSRGEPCILHLSVSIAPTFDLPVSRRVEHAPMSLETNSDRPPGVDIVDIAAYAAMLTMCMLFFPSGGAAGVAGAVVGAAYGAWRGEGHRSRLVRAWQASIGCMWAGMLIGGLILHARTL